MAKPVVVGDLKIFAREHLPDAHLGQVIQAQVSRRGAGGLWRSRAVGRIRVRHAVGHLDHRRAGREFERERDARGKGATVCVPGNIKEAALRTPRRGGCGNWTGDSLEALRSLDALDTLLALRPDLVERKRRGVPWQRLPALTTSSSPFFNTQPRIEPPLPANGTATASPAVSERQASVRAMTMIFFNSNS